MGAFGEGFRMGGDMYDSAERMRLAKEQQQMAKEEFGLRKEQHGWLKSAEEGKTALREAIASQGDLSTISPDQVMAGPAPQGVPTGTYEGQPAGGYTIPGATPEQKLSNIQQRALAGGANPSDLQSFMSGHLTLGSAQRQAKLDAQFDATMNTLHKESTDRLNTIKTTAESGGLKGLAETFGPELNKAFGHDVKYNAVPGGNGEIVVMDGKKVLTRISNLGDATAALEKLAGQEFTNKFNNSMMRPGMFKSAAELTAFMNKKDELDIKRGELGVHQSMYGPGGTYERVHDKANAAMSARNSEKSISARAQEYATALVDAGTINPATKQPYTPEEAKKYALSVALHDPNAKAKSAWTMSADGSFRSNAEGVVQDFDTKTNTWKTRGLPEVSANANKLGVIADIGSNGQVGFKGKDGWYSSEQEAVQSFAAKPSSAIPVKGTTGTKEDTAKYTRTQIKGGGYSYTYSPRSGKTKAEWAALDASK